MMTTIAKCLGKMQNIGKKYVNHLVRNKKNFIFQRIF